MCLYANSLFTAAQRCEAPALLVGGIFGACYAEENRIRQRAIAGNSSVIEGQAAADIAIRGIRDTMGPRVQDWLARAQADNPKCRSQTPNR